MARGAFVKPKKAASGITRRTNEQIFLDCLIEKSGDDKKLVSNTAMLDGLKWDREKYNRIKNQLKEQQKVEVGKGYGGSLRPTSMDKKDMFNIFISYSHKDEDIKNMLVRHLEPLKKLKLVNIWHDGKISPGEDLGKKIGTEINKAHVILLIISIDYINSKYCYDVELEEAIDRHVKGESRVIPIIARNCYWKHTPFSTLLALPKDGRPIASWPPHDIDSVYTEIVTSLKDAIVEML
ncbi:MAG: toll/interleukin-1 receptor domain-containing protein [Alphaproteobacteria bacterium]|nr:toll/interleukin-1 receptor domain-containing protein [Alphaproteobacteria bacterium]